MLVGASYGGVPVTGAADRTADRIKLVVYVDALVPLVGQSTLDLLPEAFGAMVRSGVDEHGPRWRVPMPPDLLATLLPAGALPDDVRARYAARVRGQPAATFTEPIHLTGAAEHLPRVCPLHDHQLHRGMGEIRYEACPRRARGRLAVPRALAPHDPQVFDPVGIAAVLEELTDAASTQ